MADALLSAQATSQRDCLAPDNGGNESLSNPIHGGLCIHCQALSFNERDLELDVNHHRFFVPHESFNYTLIHVSIRHIRKDSLPNLPSITATGDAGCQFCKMLLSNKITQSIMKIHSTDSTETPILIEFFYRSGWSTYRIKLFVEYTTVDVQPKRHSLGTFLVEADPDTPCAQVPGIQTKTFLPNWNFEDKVALIRDWIGDWEDPSNPKNLDGTLPTRLLDLSSTRDLNHGIRLIYSKDIPRSAGCKYAALSHCWGSPDLPPLKTEMETLDKMLCNIPFASLPANYRDAVRVSRGLGMDYLWIDSLCIVQDNLEDWETEASRMVDVYQQAYVTIVAATGNCCHDGFLEPKAAERVKIPYVSSMAGSPIKDTYYLREEYHEEKDIQDSPWNHRGWTLQEGAFSTRLLFFTQNSISYLLGSTLYLMDGRRVTDPRIQTVESLYMDVAEWGWAEWHILIEDYSRRHLTRHQDRLPAISAWARLMSEWANERYLAGLWEHNLTPCLLWSCDAASSTQTLAKRLESARKENFLAPSWSWASQKRSIHYPWEPRDQTDRYRILEIEVSPVGANTFGRLKSGHMIISGALQPLPLTPIQRCADLFQSTVDNGNCIQYYMDWWEEGMDVASGENIQRRIVQDVKMLHLAHCTKPRLFGGSKPCVWGLLVLPTGTDEEYWRVGMFLIQLEWGCEDVALLGFDCEWSTVKIV